VIATSVDIVPRGRRSSFCPREVELGADPYGHCAFLRVTENKRTFARRDGDLMVDDSVEAFGGEPQHAAIGADDAAIGRQPASRGDDASVTDMLECRVLDPFTATAGPKVMAIDVAMREPQRLVMGMIVRLARQSWANGPGSRERYAVGAVQRKEHRSSETVLRETIFGERLTVDRDDDTIGPLIEGDPFGASSVSREDHQEHDGRTSHDLLQSPWDADAESRPR